MSKELILNNISSYIHLEENEQQLFLSFLQEKHLKRKDLLLEEGEVCRASAFVIQGCLRSFTVDKNGLEHVLHFAPANWWIADMYSLITQKPGLLNIEALEDSVVLLLPKINQERLYTEIPKFERFFRILLEKSLVTHQQRLLDNLSLTAEERYHNFCKRYPTLIEKLPQKQIAAYIGVTPEFFSRMRSEILRKK